MHLEFQNKHVVDKKDNCKWIFVNHNYIQSDELNMKQKKATKQTCGQVKKRDSTPANTSNSFSHNYLFDSPHLNVCDLVKLELESLSHLIKAKHNRSEVKS